MSPAWKEILWHQACPDELWNARLWDATLWQVPEQPGFSEFWYIGYHAIFWLDYYSSDSSDSFTVPAPFTETELNMDEALPERVYTKQELQTYLDYARHKCRAQIENLQDENQPQRVRDNWRVKTIAELMLYNMRHVQEHGVELSMFLGQKGIATPGWVGQVTPR